MGRLIDADAIVEYVRKYSPISDGADLLETWLEYAPTVDAVPVVRCKDCIRFFPDDDVWGWCTVSGKMRCKDYCSYGVREDGDDAEGTIQKERS